MRKKDDIIVLAGKGHEDYQILAGGVKIHFDEREVVADALKSLKLREDKRKNVGVGEQCSPVICKAAEGGFAIKIYL